MNARTPDHVQLQSAIAKLIGDFEAAHHCEVSSVWLEHLVVPGEPEVTVVVKPYVIVR